MEALSLELDAARSAYWEDPSGSLATAIRCQDEAGLRGRALALQGAVLLHRGDLHGAFALATEAEPHAERRARPRARARRAQGPAVVLHRLLRRGAAPGRGGDRARRRGRRPRPARVRPPRGLHGVRQRRRQRLARRLQEVLALSIAAGDRWQEAISRNDLACWHQREGRLDGGRGRDRARPGDRRASSRRQPLRARRPALHARRHPPARRPRRRRARRRRARDRRR